jgi:hypothetical protein
MQFAKDDDRLARHGTWCGRFIFMVSSGHHPHRLLEIDLPPARQAQFAGPEKQQRRAPSDP